MLHEVLILARKEFLECKRELRSFTLFVLFCSFFFPQFVIFGSPKVSSALLEDSLKAEVVRVGIKGDRQVMSEVLKSHDEIRVFPIEKGMDPVSAIKSDKLDVAVLIPDELGEPALLNSTDTRHAPEVVVLYDAQKETSLTWVIDIATKLSGYNSEFLKKRFKALGIDETEYAEPKVLYQSVTSPQDIDSSTPLSRTLPLVVLFFVSTVAISGAIGGITIERENKRLLYMMLSPINRSSIMYSLLLVLSTLSLLPIILGSLATELMFHAPYVVSKLAKHGITISISVENFFSLILLTIPLAVAIVATALCFSTLFRTSQQARGYSLLYMVAVNALSSWVLSLNIGWPYLVFIPIVNVAQCMRTALTGTYEWTWIIASTAYSLAFAYLVTREASKLLAREDLLMGVDKAPNTRKSAKSSGVLPNSA